MRTRGTGTRFSMHWSPEAQEMRVGEVSYAHAGTTRTFPSHDLSHLLVAAASDLEWNPNGSDRELRLAEYNAVFLDVMLSHVTHTVRDRFAYQPSILGSVLKRMRWFVYKHYTPFPVEAEEAYCRFCSAIDPEALVRLSPYFFDLRLIELESPAFLSRDWRLDFFADHKPPASDIVAECQDVLRAQLQRMTALTNRTPSAGRDGAGEPPPRPRPRRPAGASATAAT